MNSTKVFLLALVMVVLGGFITWFTMAVAMQVKPAIDTTEATRAATQQAEEAALEAEVRLAAQIEELNEKSQQLATRNEELTQENQQLAERVAELTAQIETPPPVSNTATGEDSAQTGGLPVAFGAYGDLEQLLDADWAGMAESVGRMHEMIEELFTKILAGEEPTMDEQIAIARENQSLSQYALQVIGKLPTSSTGNGEYAHPITLSNLTAELLDQAGVPLSDAQRSSISDLGQQYEKSWQALQAGYGPETITLEKFIDELSIKQEFMEGSRRQLSSAQLEYATPANITDRTRMDVLSPVVMTVGLGRVVRGKDAESLKSNYMDAVSNYYGIDRAQLDDLGYVFENWLSAVQPVLTPTASSVADFYNLDSAVVGGQAHVRVVQDLLASATLDEAMREKLRTQKLFAVPVLVE